MFVVDEKNMAITITRGDTATLEVSFSGDAPGQEDLVIASLKRGVGKGKALKEWTLLREENGQYLMQIKSEDTEPLPFGEYAWDLRIIYNDGQITTPFAACPFVVSAVVTDLPKETGDDP